MTVRTGLRHPAMAVVILTSVALSPADAASILPGFDLFETADPTRSTITHSLGPITVDFRGVPFPAVNGLGTTDTIVRRTGSALPLPPGGTGTVDIELVALHLVSVNPITISSLGTFDVHATINQGGIIAGLPQPDSLLPSLGTLTISSHNDALQGGTFDSVLNVNANIILTPPGGDPVTQAILTFPSQEGQIVATGIAWSHVPSPNYPFNLAFPAGNFFVPVQFSEDGPLTLHTIRPPTITNGQVPEPASIVIFSCFGLAVVGTSVRRRSRTFRRDDHDPRGVSAHLFRE